MNTRANKRKNKVVMIFKFFSLNVHILYQEIVLYIDIIILTHSPKECVLRIETLMRSMHCVKHSTVRSQTMRTTRIVRTYYALILVRSYYR